MLACSHCTADMDNGALFCDYCGAELDDPSRNQRTPAPVTPFPGAELFQRPPLDRIPNAVVLRLPSGRHFILRGKDEYIIGRVASASDHPDVDLNLENGYEKGVSRIHTTIYQGPDDMFVADMDSLNETIHNGYRLGPFQRYQLRDGDQLKLAGIMLRVEFQYD